MSEIKQIKASDLRLGNIVNVPREDQSPFRIDLIEHCSLTYLKVGMDIHTYTLPGFGEIKGHPLTWELKDISGVPLNEEILVKLGFVKVNNSFYLDPFFVYKSEYSKDSYGLIKIKGCGLLTYANHLHQLQNIYFALTGTELNTDKLFER